MCRLLKTFPSFTEQYVSEELTSAQGWAFYAWATEDAATMMGERLARKSKGYVAQEAEKLKHG